VRRIPFDHVIPLERQDRTLKQKLAGPEVRAAVLAWAVRGCLEWQAHGLGTAKAIETSTAAYRSDMDRVAGFFAECCVFEAGAKEQTSVLRHAYEEWCREQGIRSPLGGKEFAKRLQEHRCEGGKSDGKRVWKSVRLLATWEEPRDTGTAQGHVPQNFSHGKITQTLSGGPVPLPSLSGQPSLFDDPDIEREAIRDA
jgi:phage/plasmid-associated DNA primase